MALFLTLYVLSLGIDTALIPLAHREYYARTADRNTVLVSLGWHLIPLAGWYEWERVETNWQIAGIFIWAAGEGLLIWARQVNPWFTGQLMRPGWLVQDGPYRYMRHPGYMGMTMLTLATFCILQQWPMIPLAAGYIALLWLQARKENKLLYA